MSASRKKKERNQQKAEATQNSKQARISKEMRDTLIVIGVVVVVLAALIVGLLVYRHEQERKLLEPDYDVNIAASTLGEQNISVPTMNYYYLTAINNFYTNYQNYISIFFDPTIALDQQEYTGAPFFGGDYATWDDYFMGQAQNSITEYYNLYKSATDDGYTLTEDDQKAIDTAVTTVENAADKAGFSSTDLYLAALYGSGCNLENYKEFITVQQLSNSYYRSFSDGVSFTDDEITAAYDEDPIGYDGVNYLIFTASASGKTDEDGNHVDATEEELQEAADKAEAMKEAFDDEKATAVNDRTKTSVADGTTEEAAEWLFDSARKAGDVELFSNKDNTAHYVIKFVSMDTHDYDTANVKLIYISKTASDEEDAPAPEKQYELLMNNLDADPSEENFDALIASDSDDSGVANDKGVKEAVHKYTYPAEADEWLFGGEAEVGTYRAFEDESGYYVLWLTGYGENYRHTLVNNALITKANEDWLEAHAHTNELVLNEDMMQYVTHGVVISQAA